MFTKEELELIYSLLIQCQYGQVKELRIKIEKELNKNN